VIQHFKAGMLDSEVSERCPLIRNDTLKHVSTAMNTHTTTGPQSYGSQQDQEPRITAGKKQQKFT
jgi:hypothetical protein